MASSQKKNNSPTTIITVDGPAGAGKSTVAKKLAQLLGFFHLDTGAMYRALTYKALSNKINVEDEGELIALAKTTVVDLENSSSGIKVLLDGQDVSEVIRTVEVTNNTAHVAGKPGVREVMLEWQRAVGHKQNVVIEGRDTGTVVFPDATYKFYMDADLEERVRRRADELKEKGADIDIEKLKEEMTLRDHKDMSRSVGPLKKADDAIVIDSTQKSVDQTAEEMFEIIKQNG